MNNFSEFLRKKTEDISFSDSLFLISINFMEATDEDLNYFFDKLKSNKNLKRIGFKRCRLYKCNLNVLSKLFKALLFLSSLESIELISDSSKEEGDLKTFSQMASVLQLPALREIDFSYNYLFSKGLIAVDSLRKIVAKNNLLKKIILTGNQIGQLSETEFEEFCDFLRNSNLEEIHLSDNMLSLLSEHSFFKLFEALSSLKFLSKLYLNTNDFSGKRLCIFSDFLETCKLETLDLSYCNLGKMESSPDEWRIFFQGMFKNNTLKNLKISSNQLGNNISDDAWDGEDRSPQFSLPEFFMNHIREWTTLERLDISNNDFHSFDIPIRSIAKILLTRNPKLGEHFSFSTPQITKDFSGIGCCFDMDFLIQETSAYLEEQKIRQKIDEELTQNTLLAFRIVTQETPKSTDASVIPGQIRNSPK